jgi:hypothetical protein
MLLEPFAKNCREVCDVVTIKDQRFAPWNIKARGGEVSGLTKQVMAATFGILHCSAAKLKTFGVGG